MAWYRCRHKGDGGVTPVGDATDGDVLSGKTYMNALGASTGTMPNRGAVSPSGLNCDGSYTIPAGYHNGSGKVTANSLASQTGVDSGKSAVTAGTMVSGYQGWVNGTKITGTIPSKATATYNTSTSDQTISSGQYLSGTQTIRKVITSGNITAGNIKTGVTMQVGDAGNGSRIVSATGTFTKSGTQSSGQTVAAAGQILSGYSAWANAAEVKGSMPARSNGTYVDSTGIDGVAPWAYIPYGYYPSYSSNRAYVYFTAAQVQNFHKHTETATPTGGDLNNSQYNLGEKHSYRYVNTAVCYTRGSQHYANNRAGYNSQNGGSQLRMDFYDIKAGTTIKLTTTNGTRHDLSIRDGNNNQLNTGYVQSGHDHSYTLPSTFSNGTIVIYISPSNGVSQNMWVWWYLSNSSY